MYNVAKDVTIKRSEMTNIFVTNPELRVQVDAILKELSELRLQVDSLEDRLELIEEETYVDDEDELDYADIETKLTNTEITEE
jgi:hypothetical protein